MFSNRSMIGEHDFKSGTVVGWTSGGEGEEGRWLLISEHFRLPWIRENNLKSFGELNLMKKLTVKCDVVFECGETEGLLFSLFLRYSFKISTPKTSPDSRRTVDFYRNPRTTVEE